MCYSSHLQAFLAANGRLQPSPPIIWGGDSGRQAPGSSSSSSRPVSDDPVTTSNWGPEANCSGRYSSSIQSFDDWDVEDECALTVACNMPVNEAVHGASAASSTSHSSNCELLGWPSVGQLMPASASTDLCVPGDLLTTRSLLQSLREVSGREHNRSKLV